MKVIVKSTPKGSIVVQCENPNCNAIISVAPDEWKIWYFASKLSLLWLGHKTSLINTILYD